MVTSSPPPYGATRAMVRAYFGRPPAPNPRPATPDRPLDRHQRPAGDLFTPIGDPK